MRECRLAVALLTLAASFFPRAARATPSAELVYSRSPDASSCPDEDALRRAVATRVGYDAFFPWAKRKVTASITRRGGAFVASVDLVDEQGFTHGSHELQTGGPCRELLDTVALAIAIAIDPRLLLPQPPAAPADPPADSPPAPPEPIASPPPAPVQEESVMPRVPPGRALALEGSVGVVASTGVAPSVGLGFGIGAAVRWRAVSLGLEGRIDAPASADAAGGGTVSSWLALGAILPCGHLGPLFLCGVAQGGSMQSSSSGVTDKRSTSLAWWAAGGRLGVLVPMGGSLLLRVRGDVVADLSPATLVLDGANVWVAPPVAASLGTDVVVRFP